MASAVFAERLLHHPVKRLEIKLYVQGGHDWTLNVSTVNGLDEIPGSTELGRFKRPEDAMNALYRRVTRLKAEGYAEGKLGAKPLVTAAPAPAAAAEVRVDSFVKDGFRTGRVIRLERRAGQDGAVVAFPDGSYPSWSPLSALTIVQSSVNRVHK